MPEYDMFAMIVSEHGAPADARLADHAYPISTRTACRQDCSTSGSAMGGSWNGGRNWLCDPELPKPVVEAVFEGDPELSPVDLIAYGYDAFGKVLLWHRTRRTVRYEAPDGIVTVANSKSYADIDTGKPTSEDFTIGVDAFGSISSSEPAFVDENGKDLLPLARRKLGRLAPGEIYGFAPALAAGGARRLETVCKAPVHEHLMLLASIEAPTLYSYMDVPGTFGRLDPLRPIGG